MLADALGDRDLHPLHRVSRLLRRILLLLGHRGPLLLLLLDRLEVAGGRLAGEVFRDQVIAGVTVLDGHDIAPRAEPADLVSQNDLHGSRPFV